MLICRADSRLAPSQWEMSLQSNVISHRLGANLESTLLICIVFTSVLSGWELSVQPWCETSTQAAVVSLPSLQQLPQGARLHLHAWYPLEALQKIYTRPGSCFNMESCISTREGYGDSYYKDKMVVKPSYLYIRNLCTCSSVFTLKQPPVLMIQVPSLHFHWGFFIVYIPSLCG